MNTCPFCNQPVFDHELHFCQGPDKPVGFKVNITELWHHMKEGDAWEWFKKQLKKKGT